MDETAPPSTAAVDLEPPANASALPIDSRDKPPPAVIENGFCTPQKASSSDVETPPDAAAQRSTLDLPISAADGLIQQPFARPFETAQAPRPPDLTSEQQSKYQTVLDTVSAWTTVPTSSAKDAAREPITDGDRMFLTRECLLRYLRATKWNVNDALARLQGTLVWRREYGVHKLTPEYISVENETGKQVILGYDKHARPCLYLLPKNQNTDKSDRQIQHLVFMLERVIDLSVPDQETLALVVNFNETRSGQNATLGQAKQTLNILQYHYPERLGRALVINSKLLRAGLIETNPRNVRRARRAMKATITSL